MHAVVLEMFVERLHAHRADALGNQVADGIIHHRAGHAGVQAEAVGEVGGDVEFAAADVNVAARRFAERNDARIKAVDQRAQGQEVQRAGFADVQTSFHFLISIVVSVKSNVCDASQYDLQNPVICR